MNDGNHDLIRALEKHESDWTIAWLIEHADQELWAPRQFIIVDELTKGSPTLAAAWRAIYRLWIFYKPSGRTHFGLRMIASVGGISYGRMHTYVRDLLNLGLITVNGMRSDAALEANPSGPWTYSIDVERLEAMSIKLIRSRLSAGQLVAKRRSPEAYQRSMFVALDLVADEELLEVAPADEAYLAIPTGRVREPAAVAATRAHQGRQATPDGVTGSPGFTVTQEAATESIPDDVTSARSFASPTPDGVSVPAGVARLTPGGVGQMTPDSALTPDGVIDQPSALNAAPPPNAPPTPGGVTFSRDRHPTMTPQHFLTPHGVASIGPVSPSGEHRHHPVAPAVPDAAYDHQRSASSGAIGSEERENDRMKGRVSAERAAHVHTPTLTDIESLIDRTLNERLPLFIDRLSALLAPAGTGWPMPHGSAGPAPHPPIPPPPGEPVLPLPLLSIWEQVTGTTPVSTSDQTQIAMLIERYQEPTGGYSAYWIGRAMLYAQMCCDDKKSVGLKTINSFMQRMAKPDVGYSTAALEDRKYTRTRSDRSAEPRQLDITAPTINDPHMQESSALPHSPATRPQSAANHAVPSAERLDDTLDTPDAVHIWRTFAGPNVALTSTRAQQITNRIADVTIWTAVLTNWRAQYQSRANWANLDALFERYDREMAADSRERTTLPSGPHIPSTVLYYHPALAEHELRTLWTHRHNAATDKAAKQEVLQRLLTEHPIPPELAEQLGITTVAVAEPMGGVR
jgi:hypothetical protein